MQSFQIGCLVLGLWISKLNKPIAAAKWTCLRWPTDSRIVRRKKVWVLRSQEASFCDV